MKCLWFVSCSTLIVLLSCSFSWSLRLLAIQDGMGHTLQNQHDGTFLSAAKSSSEGADHKLTTGEQSKDEGAGQRWIFNVQGKDIYMISRPINDKQQTPLGGKYELIRVGHGKRLIKNIATQLCISNAGRGRPVGEKKCDENDGKQRWYIEPIKSA